MSVYQGLSLPSFPVSFRTKGEHGWPEGKKAYLPSNIETDKEQKTRIMESLSKNI